MSIYREIEVTRKRLDVCIDYVYGTDILPIELKVMDYEIPAGASVVAYNEGNSNKVLKQFCEVNDNVVSFKPEKGFFEKGRNELQYRVVHDNRSLFSFMCKVNCEKSYADDDAEEVASQPTLVERILSVLGLSDGTGDAAGGLPTVTEADNGKVLQVVDGVWKASEITMTSELPSEEGVKF